jgi:hypothetical protein
MLFMLQHHFILYLCYLFYITLFACLRPGVKPRSSFTALDLAICTS